MKNIVKEKVWGFDSGVSSLGSSILDLAKKTIEYSHVRIFSSTIANTGKIFKSLASQRTEKKQLRKQIDRLQQRKRNVLKKLQQLNMCPAKGTNDFKKWVSLCPYIIGGKAHKEQISQNELGRLLYYFTTKRGYVQANEKINFKQNDKNGNTIIGPEQNIAQSAGFPTFISFLDSLTDKDKGTDIYDPQKRKLTRITTRKMRKHDFNTIVSFQAQFYPELLNEYNIKNLHDVIFFQRGLRKQERGACALFPDKIRSLKSSPSFQSFRIHSFLSNIRVENEDGNLVPLSIEQKEKCIKLMRGIEENTKTKKPTQKIREKLTIASLLKTMEISKVVCNFKNDQDVPVDKTGQVMKLIFPNWYDFEQKIQDTIWNKVIFGKNDIEWLSKNLHKYRQSLSEDKKILEEKKINIEVSEIQKILLSNPLEQGTCSYSKKAIESMLVHLKNGFDEYNSKHIVISNEIVKSESLTITTEEIEQTIKNGVVELTNLLREMGAPEKKLEWLSLGIYGNVQAIKKNLSHSEARAISHFEKEILYMEKHFGFPEYATIEMGREISMGASALTEFKNKQNLQKKENERIRQEIIKLKQTPNRDNVNKYKLWEESKKTCVYTGQPISITELFNGAVHVEHIFPRHLTFENGMNNLTLCKGVPGGFHENFEKGERTPYKAYGHNKEVWNKIKKRAKELLPTHKYARFISQDHQDVQTTLNKFFNQNSRIAVVMLSILRSKSIKTNVTIGRVTAELRHFWGLNSLIGDSEHIKNRDNALHHGLDAIVIAATSRQTFTNLSKSLSYEGRRERFRISPPWEGFRLDVNETLSKTIVSHYSKNRLWSRGKTSKNKKQRGDSARIGLHADSIYGCQNTIIEGKKVAKKINNEIQLVKKVKIIDLPFNDIAYHIVDNGVKEVLIKVVEKHFKNRWENIKEIISYRNTLSKKGKKDLDNELKKILSNPIRMKTKLGNENRAPLIKSVRILYGSKTAVQTKRGWVEPDGNYCYFVWKMADGSIKSRIVTNLEMVKAKKNNIDIETECDGKCIMKIRKGDMLIKSNGKKTDEMNGAEFSQSLYFVSSMSLNQIRIRKHIDASSERLSLKSIKWLINNGFEQISLKELERKKCTQTVEWTV